MQKNNQNTMPNARSASTGAPVGNSAGTSGASTTTSASGARQSRPQGASRTGEDTRRPVAAGAHPQEQKKTARTVVIVLGVVVAALLIWLLVWLFACNGSSLFDPSAQTGQAPYKTDEEIQAELDRVVEEGMFNISIASVIQFDGSENSGTAYIENVPGNRYNMRVAITDDETGETIYESGVLKPNQYIEKIALTHDLDPGMHEATAVFTALDPDTNEETGKAAAKVTLNVIES